MALMLVGGIALFCWAGREMKPKGALPDKTPPPTQVSLEFAATPNRVATLLNTWSPEQKSGLRRGIYFDFLFIIGYAIPLAILVSWLSRYLGRSWSVLGELGAVIAWAQLVAGGLDVIENFLLLAILRGSKVPAWPPLACLAASVKFGFVGLGFVWIASSLVIALWLKVRPSIP
jgi:hypothetical protein